MSISPALNSIPEILATIRTDLAKAQDASDSGEKENAEYLVERAFVAMRLLLEAAALPHALSTLQQIENNARENFAKASISEIYGEPYLVWSSILYHYTAAVEALFGEPKIGIVTKDIIQILRETQYSITDQRCFSHPPQNERDVHVRIEAVLRCIFPDLIHKPPVAKQIKHFEPDTGLPGIHTLVEYKFISTTTEAKRVADEVLADTRGYTSKEWNKVIYVIYETKRLKSEKQWNQLLRTSGVGGNTSIIVIHGEEPRKRLAVLRKAAGATS